MPASTMSSATSIKTAAGARTERKAASDSFRPWHFFVLLSLVGATAAVLTARQPSPEHLVLISVSIAAAGLCAAALYATLAPLVRKETAAGRLRLSERARAVLEREKMLVLRSIKDLEFDRAMGKVSAADFDEMAGRLRARALTLMKQLDSPGAQYRAVIEQAVARRLENATALPPGCACGTANDADAMFCKRCGTRLRPADGPEAPPL
jgi:hypothetical protein